MEAPVKAVVVGGEIARGMLRPDRPACPDDRAFYVSEAGVDPFEAGSTPSPRRFPGVITVWVKAARAIPLKQNSPSPIACD
jgi:hypothetical protein